MSRDEKELLAKPALLDKELLAKSSDLERASSQPVAEPTKDVPQNESSSNGELHGLPLIAITISIMLCVFILELDKTVTSMYIGSQTAKTRVSKPRHADQVLQLPLPQRSQQALEHCMILAGMALDT